MKKKTENIETLGILGLGSIGFRHAKNCIDQKIKVFGFDECDLKLKAAHKIGVTIVSRKKIIESTSNFIICTPSCLHHKDLNFVLKRAKHVLVEKPITHNYLLTSNLLKKNKSVKVYTAFNLRFHVVVKEIKKFLKKGLLGRILWSNSVVCSDLRKWRPGTDYKNNYTNNLVAGGVINDYSHEIDLINFFFGKNKKVLGFLKNSKTLGLKVEDYSSIIMENKTNIFSSINFDYCCGPSIRKGMIRGIKASLFYNLLKRRIKIIKNNGEVFFEKKYDSNFDEEYKDEIKSFIKEKERYQLASWRDGIEASKVIDKIYKNCEK